MNIVENEARQRFLSCDSDPSESADQADHESNTPQDSPWSRGWSHVLVFSVFDGGINEHGNAKAQMPKGVKPGRRLKPTSKQTTGHREDARVRKNMWNNGERRE